MDVSNGSQHILDGTHQYDLKELQDKLAGEGGFITGPEGDDTSLEFDFKLYQKYHGEKCAENFSSGAGFIYDVASDTCTHIFEMPEFTAEKTQDENNSTVYGGYTLSYSSKETCNVTEGNSTVEGKFTLELQATCDADAGNGT